MSFNQITIVGNLGKDPEIVTLKSELKVTKFSLAVTTSRKEGSEYKKSTTWYNIASFGRKGEWFGEKAKKGNQACVIGTLKPREWTDNDGNTRIAFDVEDVTTIELLSSFNEEVKVAVAATASAEANNSDLPF